jgi:translation initiation factor 2B subunit (eIF-2B alpha/beta/delta family)
VNELIDFFHCAAEDRRHGATEIERRLISGLLAESGRWTVPDLASGARRLLEGQPAMANLRNLARVLAGDRLTVTRQQLERRSKLLAELDRRFAASAREFIEGAARIVTISRSSAVAAVLEGAWRFGWRGETVIFDGVPVGSGSDQMQRLAETMEHLQAPPDSVISEWLVGIGIKVVIGADAVSPRRLVNATGTRTLLELAAAGSVPVAVVADSGKDLPDDEIDWVVASSPVVVEEGTGRRRPIFEVIPVNLVSMRISE